MTEQQIENHSGVAGKTEKPGWEHEVMEKLVFAAVTEQRRTRRWGIFFKSLMFAYLLVILVIAVYPRLKSGIGDAGDQHTAVIKIVGVIAEGEEANAESIIKGLRNAIKDKGTKGIILHINTPGGSPVQSADVYEEIMRTRKANPDIKIYAVVSDICASGGYYIASAADKIYVNQASIVGSIGVIMNGFGFVDTLKKYGVERRLLTSGSHKALMDPFSPINKRETEHMQTLLNQVHQQFIDAVRQGRGERLKESPEIFSGLVWTGTESVKLGLADDFGNDDFVAREIVGVEKRVDFTLQERLLDRLTGKLGASFGRGFSSFIQGMTLR
jgi:protease-4